MLRKLARQGHFSVYTSEKGKSARHSCTKPYWITIVFPHVLRKGPPRLSAALRTMSVFFPIRLPFSFADVIDNLRLEHYAGLDADHLVYELAEVSSQENSLR